MSSIGIDWKILIPQIINFLILFLILRWLLYKPILKILTERKKKIDDSLALAEKTRRDADELEIKNQEKINLVKTEAKKIIDETREQVKKESDEMKASTLAEIQKLKDKSKEEIEFERKKMLDNLKGELAELILLTSGKLMKESVKVEVQNHLVEEAIKQLEGEELKT